MRRTRFGEVVNSMKLRALCAVLLLALAAAFSPPGARANATTDAGALWLLASQGPDGSWRSARDARGIRTTALAVSALAARALLASGLAPAVDADGNGADDMCDVART